MLKMLRYDFYKIIKSKMLFTLLLVSIALCMVNPILNNIVASKNENSILFNLNGSTMILCMFWIFVIPFVAKDFSSKYMININSHFKYVWYILSKVLYIIIFCFLLCLFSFLFELLLNFAFGSKILYSKNDNFTVKQFFAFNFMWFVNDVALCTSAMFLAILFKKEYIAVIILVPYLFFFSSMIYSAINTAVGNSFLIERYTIFGLSNSADFNIPSEVSKMMSHTLVPLCYIVLFSALSWLILKLRRG